MRFISALFGSVMTAVAVWPACSAAQNLIDNSNFYSTMSPWKTFTPDWAYFTPAVNHTPGGGGSVILGGGSVGSVVSQCVGIVNGEQYVVSAWVKAACPGNRLQVYWTASSCDVGPDYDFVESTKSGEWEQLILASDQAPDKNRAIVFLINPGGSTECSSGVFFDDISVQKDKIFWDPFDEHGLGL
ncbi:MAG: hypothetical protein ABJB01_06450 [Rudaea sp.]